MSTNPTPYCNSSEAVQFEHLLVYLSMPTERASEDQVRKIIKTTQQSHSDILESCHSGLARFDEQSKLFMVNDLSKTTRSAHGFAEGDLPWVAYKVFRGDAFEFSNITEISGGVSTEIDKLFDAQIQSATFLPLSAGEQRFGFLGFASSQPETRRPPGLHERLLAIADDFSDASAGDPPRLAPPAGELESIVDNSQFQTPFADFAKAAGYTNSGSGPQAFNGYYYRILTKQGDKTKGGAMV